MYCLRYWTRVPGCHYVCWLLVNSHLIKFRGNSHLLKYWTRVPLWILASRQFPPHCVSGEIGNFPTQLSRSKGYENIGKLPPQALSAVDWPSKVVFVSLLNRSPPPRRFYCNSLFTKWYNDRINRWWDRQCGCTVYGDLKNEKGEFSQYFVWFSFLLVVIFNSLLHQCPLAVRIKGSWRWPVMIVLEILSLLTNTNRLITHLWGRCRAGDLPYFLNLFPAGYIGWEITDFADTQTGWEIYLWPWIYPH